MVNHLVKSVKPALSLLKLYSTTASVSLLNICLHRYRTFTASPLSRSSFRRRARPRCHRQVLKLMRCHGTSDDSLRHVYKAVVLSKLLYAWSAWWGYTSAADKQRLEATVRRAIRLSLHTADNLTPSLLAADIGNNLLAKILNNSCHVLYKLLPNNTEHTYNLRPRCHSSSLAVKTNCNNFCLSNAMHGHNINLPVCVCVCVCVCLYVRHTFCQPAYRSDTLTDFYSW